MIDRSTVVTRLVEEMSNLEHEQWMSWASSIMQEEDLFKERKQRWSKYMVPYDQLEEDIKEHDRIYAKKVIAVICDYCCGHIQNYGDCIEAIAKLEHEQWVHWASGILKEENISEERKQLWKQRMVSYDQLEEDIKEYYRGYARKALEILENIREEISRIISLSF